MKNTSYCSSVGCPKGYSLIKDAHDVECDNGKCKEKQCCEAFCSSYACPDNYTPAYGTDSIKCDYSGCTTDKCCDYGEPAFGFGFVERGYANLSQ